MTYNIRHEHCEVVQSESSVTGSFSFFHASVPVQRSMVKRFLVLRNKRNRDASTAGDDVKKRKQLFPETANNHFFPTENYITATSPSVVIIAEHVQANNTQQPLRAIDLCIFMAIFIQNIRSQRRHKRQGQLQISFLNGNYVNIEDVWNLLSKAKLSSLWSENKQQI